MTFPICPCDGADIASPTNLPQLSHVGYRVGSYADFRRAVLTPLDGEVTLANLNAPGQVVIRATSSPDCQSSPQAACPANILQFNVTVVVSG